mgnify:CR=1 FL=1
MLQDTLDLIRQWSTNHPEYYTDGKRFYANPSYRKRVGLTYVGACSNAKEARRYYQECQRILKGEVNKKEE